MDNVIPFLHSAHVCAHPLREKGIEKKGAQTLPFHPGQEELLVAVGLVLFVLVVHLSSYVGAFSKLSL